MRHPRWGAGVVLKRLAFKALRVAFDDAPDLPRTVKTTDVEAIESPAESAERRAARVEARDERRRLVRERQAALAADAACSAPREVHQSELEAEDAWQTLEALRLGVVPARGVAEYTVGRERELESLGDLFEARRGCRVLWGDYGTGKTHLLETVEQIALEQGFAVARMTLDPLENALHHPLRLYQKIAGAVRTREQVGPGLDWLFEQLAGSDDHRLVHGASASRFLSPYLQVLREGSTLHVEHLREYVHGERVDMDLVRSVASFAGWRGPTILALSDYRTFGRTYTHMVGTLASWFEDAGLRGLVLLFDEVERVDTLSATDQAYALEVLRHYAAVTMDEEDLAFEPDSLYRGGHRVHKELPLRFREDQPLTTVFALTPLEEILESFRGVTASSAYDLKLDPLEVETLGRLARRVAGLYDRAYPDHRTSGAALERIERELRAAFDEGYDNFRQAVRATVFLLDEDRSHALERQGA